MPKESESTEQIISEIKTLRRQGAELQGTEQSCRQAEAALKAIEERKRLLGDSASLGIFTIDTQGGIAGITRKRRLLFIRLSGHGYIGDFCRYTALHRLKGTGHRRTSLY